jgi:hypothetical protein
MYNCHIRLDGMQGGCRVKRTGTTRLARIAIWTLTRKCRDCIPLASRQAWYLRSWSHGGPGRVTTFMITQRTINALFEPLLASAETYMQLFFSLVWQLYIISKSLALRVAYVSSYSRNGTAIWPTSVVGDSKSSRSLHIVPTSEYDMQWSTGFAVTYNTCRSYRSAIARIGRKMRDIRIFEIMYSCQTREKNSCI